jgi:hypothetical protein
MLNEDEDDTPIFEGIHDLLSAYAILGLQRTTFRNELPIEVEIKRLIEKRVIVNNERALFDAKQLILAALKRAFDGPNEARTRRTRSKRAKTSLGAISAKLRAARMNLEDIVDFLKTEEYRKAQTELIIGASRGSFAEDQEDRMRDMILSLHTMPQTLELLEMWFGLNLKAAPNPAGRPKNVTRYFVEGLASGWVKLTGNFPKRSWDPIENRESGDFLSFCEASAATVAPLFVTQGLDTAVRIVCENYRELRVSKDWHLTLNKWR